MTMKKYVTDLRAGDRVAAGDGVAVVKSVKPAPNADPPKFGGAYAVEYQDENGETDTVILSRVAQVIVRPRTR
jgi:hypothetical protein